MKRESKNSVGRNISTPEHRKRVREEQATSLLPMNPEMESFLLG